MRSWLLFIGFFILANTILPNHALSQSSSAQSKEELEKKRKQLLQEIEDAQDQLNETRKNKNASLSEVYALKQKINARQKLIANYNSQIRNLDDDILLNYKTVKSLQIRIDSMKAEYARLIVRAYKSKGDVDKLLFLFSSKDFNDAFRRIKYLQKYSDYRLQQARKIKETQVDLGMKIKVLDSEKQEKQELLVTQNQQKVQLEEEHKAKNQVVQKLKSQESELMQKIKDKKKSAAKLNKIIEDIIRKEIEEARKNTNATSTSSKTIALTPEARALSDNFAGNKGSLPWPVERGVITEQFGTHPHEVLDNVMVNNNGIDIKTQPGAAVRAVFEGTVVKVFFNPSFQKGVIISHGEYFSVYSNLEDVTVQKGDKVKTKQTIGKVYTQPDENKTEVHLEIWKNFEKTNPESWIYNR